MKIRVGDVIEFKPRNGRQRIVEVTAVHEQGFDAVPTGARHVRVFGYHDQVIRMLRRAVPDVPHKTKVVGLGPDWVAWTCTCGHVDMATGHDPSHAMRECRSQQGRHKDEARDEAA